MRQLIDTYSTYQIKFVIDQPADCDEVVHYLVNYPQIPRNRVFLMPQGTDQPTLIAKRQWLEPWCQQQGYRYCPRKHIEWFGRIPAS
jgi:7-carboxy-7-deazaguanine synthase